MVVTQIILLSRWCSKKPSKKDQPKKLNQNGQVQINLSKMEVWSSWIGGQKNHMGGFFTKISGKKNQDFL
jgi:hypothetical protein